MLPSPLPPMPPAAALPAPVTVADRSAVPPSVVDPIALPKMPIGWIVAVAVGVVVMVVTLAVGMHAWRGHPSDSSAPSPSTPPSH